MSNTYYKMLNRQISEQRVNNVITELQKDLTFSFNQNTENLFDLLNKTNGLDMNILLKFYAINQLLKDAQSQKVKEECDENYTKTANPNYRKNVQDNLYYRMSKHGAYILEKEVVNIFEDGSYEKIEKVNLSAYKLKNIYNSSDELLSIQLIDPQGCVVANKWQAAEILGMRKEFVQKFKYSGYSGHSKDIIASIGNRLCSPIETGYYIDKHFHFYRWNANQKRFIRNTKLEMLSPLLTDYIFDSGKKVIRKEYIGK